MKKSIGMAAILTLSTALVGCEPKQESVEGKPTSPVLPPGFEEMNKDRLPKGASSKVPGQQAPKAKKR